MIKNIKNNGYCGGIIADCNGDEIEIPITSNSKKVLLIIDMQIGSFTPYSKRHNAMGIIGKINLLSNYFRKQDDLVIFTQEYNEAFDVQDFSLLPELEQKNSDFYVLKKINEAFYNTKLEEILTKYNVKELFICGISSDFCIDATVKSALGKDYKVHVVSDAHTTSTNQFLEASKIIEYYNWLWQNLNPSKYPVTVLPTNHIISNSNIKIINK